MMKKRNAAAVMALCMLLTAVPMNGTAQKTAVYASAADKLTYGELTYTVTDGCVEITGCDTGAASVEIPSEIDGMPVTSIGNTAFYGCSLTAIVIPEGITRIGSGAFWHSKALFDVTLPSTLTEIQSYAFADCAALEEIEIPAGVQYIGNAALGDTPWLTAKKQADPFVAVNGILIDASAAVDKAREAIEEAKRAAEESASGDTDVEASDEPTEPTEPEEPPIVITVPEGITRLGENIFGKNAGYVDEVVIPEGVVSIGKEAFIRCSKLAVINFPQTLEEVGDNAFKGTAWLSEMLQDTPLVIINDMLIDAAAAQGVVTIPEHVTAIHGSAFKMNHAVTGVILPEGLERIGAQAFYNCDALTSVVFPEQVRYIEKEAFYGTGLTELTIPATVQEIGEAAFINCKSLKEVTVEGTDTVIGSEAFGCTSTFTANGQYSYIFVHTVIPEFVVRCSIVSTAADYAVNTGVTPCYTDVIPGDLTGDTLVNASDAARILIAAACIGAGEDTSLTKAQSAAADVNKDEKINASDAALVLMYAAHVGAGGEGSLTEFLQTTDE